jgi:hypothetical protein
MLEAGPDLKTLNDMRKDAVDGAEFKVFQSAGCSASGRKTLKRSLSYSCYVA